MTWKPTAFSQSQYVYIFKMSLYKYTCTAEILIKISYRICGHYVYTVYINFVNYSRLDAQTLKFRLYSSTNNLFCLIVVQYSSRNNLFSLSLCLSVSLSLSVSVSLCLSVSLSTFFRHGTARLHFTLSGRQVLKATLPAVKYKAFFSKNKITLEYIQLI